MVARRGWNLALSRQPLANCAQAIKSYRAERAKHASLTGSGDAIMVRDIYVADNDEQAWREAGPELVRFWQLATDNVWRGDTIAPESLPKYTERYAYFPGGLTLEKMNEWGTSLIGRLWWLPIQCPAPRRSTPRAPNPLRMSATWFVSGPGGSGR